MPTAPNGDFVPTPAVPAVPRTRCLLPEEWLPAFNDDYRLVMVLAAHVSVRASMSERQIVERTRLDRKTVRRKKRELIDRYGVLSREREPTRGKTDACRIDWDRLKAITGFPQPGEKGTSSTSEVGEKGTSSAGEYKERAPAPASRINSLEAREKLASKPETTSRNATIRARIAATELERLGGRRLGEQTVRNIANELARLSNEDQVEEVLAVMEELCGECVANPRRAYSWGWVYRVVEDAVSAKLREGSARPKAAERKPPQKENETSPEGIRALEAFLSAFPQHPSAPEVRADLDALKGQMSMAATMGGKR